VNLCALGDEFFGPGVGVRGYPASSNPLSSPAISAVPATPQIAAFLYRRVQASPGFGIENRRLDQSAGNDVIRLPHSPIWFEVERPRAQRPAPSRLSSRQLRPVIGGNRSDLEAQTAVGLHEFQHRRAGPHERLDQSVIHRAEDCARKYFNASS